MGVETVSTVYRHLLMLPNRSVPIIVLRDTTSTRRNLSAAATLSLAPAFTIRLTPNLDVPSVKGFDDCFRCYFYVLQGYMIRLRGLGPPLRESLPGIQPVRGPSQSITVSWYSPLNIARSAVKESPGLKKSPDAKDPSHK